MPGRRYAHDSSDWDTVAMANDGEWNSRARWALAHDADGIGKEYDGLRKPVTEPLAEATQEPTRRCHVRRKHRSNCPKHAAQKLAAHVALPSHSTTASLPPSPLPADVDSKGRPWLLAPKPIPAFPTLSVPRCVGRGFATFLTGAFDGHSYKWEKRWLRQYPDYDASSVLVDTRSRDSLAHAMSKASPKGPLTAPPMVPLSAAEAARLPQSYMPRSKVPLVREAVDKSFCRLKYDLKTHMEYEYSIGKALQRL